MNSGIFFATPTGQFAAAWIAVGLLGQALFSARFLWQWIASERGKKVVVPVMFWWLSLGGASMLLAYFIWRRDPVGILGQSFGWIVYARNLSLIRAERTRPASESPPVDQSDSAADAEETF